MNPYAAPKSSTSLVYDPSHGERPIAIEKDAIVANDVLVLPDRCIKTNATGDHLKRVTKKIYYVSPLVYLGLLVNILVVIILYLVLRKKCTVTYTINKGVEAKNSIISILSLLGFIVGLAGTAIGLGSMDTMELWHVIAGGGFVILVLSLVGNYHSMPLRAARHERGVFRLKGCSPEFLDQLQAEVSSRSASQHPEPPIS